MEEFKKESSAFRNEPETLMYAQRLKLSLK